MWRKFRVELAYGLGDAIGHFHGVRPGLLDDVHGEPGAVVDQSGAPALFDAVHHTGHFREEDRAAVAHGHDQVAKILHRAELSRHAHQRLVVALLQLAGGNVQVLALQRAGDLGVGQAEGLQLLAIHQHLNLAAGQSHQVHLAHAGHILQPLLQHLLGERRERLHVGGLALHRHRHDGHRVEVDALDHGLIHVLGEIRADGVDLGLSVLLRGADLHP